MPTMTCGTQAVPVVMVPPPLEGEQFPMIRQLSHFHFHFHFCFWILLGYGIYAVGTGVATALKVWGEEIPLNTSAPVPACSSSHPTLSGNFSIGRFEFNYWSRLGVNNFLIPCRLTTRYDERYSNLYLRIEQAENLHLLADKKTTSIGIKVHLSFVWYIIIFDRTTT